MLALHKPDTIFSLRHLPTWLMLTFAAGCVNAIAVVACERFVTHVTGTVTRLGMEVARVGLLLDFAIVLAFFIAGAATSSVLINARAHRGKRPLHAAPLVIVAAATAGIAVAGYDGLLGSFGGTVDEAGDFVLLSVLSFASGLQNAAVATSTGLLVRTTHLTGPATDLGIHLVELAYVQGEARQTARRHALLRGGKIAAFAVGAAAGVTLAHAMQFLAFLVPAAVVLAATLLSFLPGHERVNEGERPALGAPSPPGGERAPAALSP
ncbi:hypothetical protein SOCE26_104160 [Sorangium cellulosum]|uniref:DUF1275 domain-containing protein n=1 Tax=Sorangium cellulosum TaxID=56 RepID=A0A2L0FBG9_SORCE|nr:YoaK family protein [Sorangium cellulosum]AUX48873.1 hypothetical protein SOCE26_104160 [Sorangium cellulosum]